MLIFSFTRDIHRNNLLVYAHILFKLSENDVVLCGASINYNCMTIEKF